MEVVTYIFKSVHTLRVTHRSKNLANKTENIDDVKTKIIKELSTYYYHLHSQSIPVARKHLCHSLIQSLDLSLFAYVREDILLDYVANKDKIHRRTAQDVYH